VVGCIAVVAQHHLRVGRGRERERERERESERGRVGGHMGMVSNVDSAVTDPLLT
jgi:hypothetical protein